MAALITAIYLGLSHAISDQWSIPIIILGKVYSNAMMVNFNHRIQFLGGRNDTQEMALTMPSRHLFSNSVVTNDEIKPEGEHKGKIQVHHHERSASMFSSSQF
jgi:hypothetical protein